MSTFFEILGIVVLAGIALMLWGGVLLMIAFVLCLLKDEWDKLWGQRRANATTTKNKNGDA